MLVKHYPHGSIATFGVWVYWFGKKVAAVKKNNSRDDELIDTGVSLFECPFMSESAEKCLLPPCYKISAKHIWATGW